MKMNLASIGSSLVRYLKENKNFKVYGSALLFAFIVGFSFLGVKTCVYVATPLEILTHRFNFAFLAALIPVLLGMIKVQFKGKPMKGVVVNSGLYAGFMILQTIGLVFSTSIESGIIFAVIPIFAKLISKALMNETTTWRQNAFMCISVVAVIAMFILGATDISVNFIGLIILTLSSLSLAGSNVMMRYLRSEYRPYEISSLMVFGGFLLFNIATIVYGVKEGSLSSYFQPLVHMEFLWATAFLGIFSTMISSQLMGYMMANMKAVQASLFGNLSTAISLIAGAILLSEPLRAYHIICTALIILGVIGVSFPSLSIKKQFVKGDS